MFVLLRCLGLCARMFLGCARVLGQILLLVILFRLLGLAYLPDIAFLTFLARLA